MNSINTGYQPEPAYHPITVTVVYFAVLGAVAGFWLMLFGVL